MDDSNTVSVWSIVVTAFAVMGGMACQSTL